jgi:hypothetical protein
MPRSYNPDTELLIGSPELMPQRPVGPPAQAQRPVGPLAQAQRPVGPSSQAQSPVEPTSQAQRLGEVPAQDPAEEVDSTSAFNLIPRKLKQQDTEGNPVSQLLGLVQRRPNSAVHPISTLEPQEERKVESSSSAKSDRTSDLSQIPAYRGSAFMNPRPRTYNIEDEVLIGSQEIVPAFQARSETPKAGPFIGEERRQKTEDYADDKGMVLIPDMVPLYGEPGSLKQIPAVVPLFGGQDTRMSIPPMEPLFDIQDPRRPITASEPVNSLDSNPILRPRRRAEETLIGSPEMAPMQLEPRRKRLPDTVPLDFAGPRSTGLAEESIEPKSTISQGSIKPFQDSVSIKSPDGAYELRPRRPSQQEEVSIIGPEVYEFKAAAGRPAKLGAMPGRTQMPVKPAADVASPTRVRHFKASKPVDRGGFLTIGDIVSMNVAIKIVPTIGHHQPFEYQGIIAADGIADLTCEVLPLAKLTENKTFVLYRQCLFRIEPSRQYGFSNRLSTYKDKPHQVEEITERLKVQMQEELNGNNAELELSFGRHITFGERIQLRHIHSDSFLTVSLNIAKENGCLQVELDSIGSESSWFEIMPVNKLRQEGEPVRYSDKFTLSTSVEKSKYYLHMQVTSLTKRNVSSEVNGCDTSTAWRAEKYISHADLKKNPSFVATGDSFRIMHQQYEGFLTVNSRDVQAILPTPVTVVPEEEARKLVKEAMCLIADVDYDANSANVIESDIFVDYTKSSLNIWELERQNFFIGGTTQLNELYRVKHISSGLFMGVDANGRLKLMSDGNSPQVLFRFVDETAEAPTLTFSKTVRIESCTDRQFIQVEKAKVDIKSFFEGVEITQKEKAKLLLCPNPKERVRTSFILVDEQEANSIHVYQISLIIPKFLEFYRYLQVWGLFVLGKERYSEDVQMAKGKEPELEEGIDRICQILNNIRTRIIRLTDNDLKSIRTRQDAVRESGLLELLICIAQLAEIRLKRRISIDPNASSSLIEEEELSSSKIAKPYLTRLVKDIYKTVRISINDNVLSCQSLLKYDSFLSSQLSFYKSEVGTILREAFSHSSDIMSAFKKTDFLSWIHQVKMVTDDNVNEQTLILKILASMCVHKDKGVLKYQLLIEQELLSRDVLKIFKFGMYRSRPCLEVDKAKLSSGFFEDSRKLVELMEDLEEECVTVVFISRLNSNEDLVGYFAAVLDLLADSCLNNFEQGIATVIKAYKLTFDLVFLCIKDAETPLALRTHFLKLAQVLFVERSSRLRLSHSHNRCYFWNDITGQIEPEPQDNIAIALNVQKPTFPADKLIQWIETCWRSVEAPFTSPQASASLREWRVKQVKENLKFTSQLLILSNSLLELNYIAYDFMTMIYTPSMLLLKTYKGSLSPTVHWCTQLKYKAASLSDVEKELTGMVTETLKLLSTASILRVNLQIEEFLEFFGRSRHGAVDQQSIAKMAVALFEGSEFNEARRGAERKKAAFQVTGRTILQVVGDEHASDVRLFEVASPERDLHLDMFLLDLVFESSAKSLKQSALNLIIKNFSQRRSLRGQMDEVYLLTDQLSRKAYQQLKQLQSAMLLKLKDLRLQSDSYEGDQLGREIASTFTQWRLNLITMQELLRDGGMEPSLEERQKMARNLGLHEIIFEFLNTSYCWITDGEQGRRKINSEAIAVYAEAMESLYKFGFKNPDNENILFSYISYIIRFFGNKVGSTRLLSQILSSQRRSSKSENIIHYVFTTLTSEVDPRLRPHDLKLLRMLIRSEGGTVHSLSQTNIFKALMQNKKLLKCYLQEDTSLDFTAYRQESAQDIRFHYNFILLLANCAIQNSFVTQQLRRLVPIDKLIGELSPERGCALNVKKAYLHFFFFVYYLHNNDGLAREIPLFKVSEVLDEVIVPDLERFREELDPWLVCCQKGICDMIPCAKAETELYKQIKHFLNVPGAHLSGMLSLKKSASVQNPLRRKKTIKDELTKEQQQSLDYWKYVTNRKLWNLELATGLFTFLFDFCADLKHSDLVQIDQTLASAFDRLRVTLQMMHDDFTVREADHPDLDFRTIIQQVNDLLAELPNYEAIDDEVPQDFAGDRSYQAVLQGCLKFMQEEHISPSEFFDMYLQDPSLPINRTEIALKLKEILGTSATRAQVDEALIFIELNSDAFNLEVLGRDIRAYFRKNTLYVRKENKPLEPVVQENANSDLRAFLNGRVSSLFSSKGNPELTALMMRVKAEVVDEALVSSNSVNLQRFTLQMDLAFRKKNHRIYLLMMFEKLISLEAQSTAHNKYVRINTLQSILSKSGIVVNALTLLTSSNDVKIIDRAVNLLLALLKYNTGEVKQTIYDYLLESPITFEIFAYIKVLLRESYDRISHVSAENLARRMITSQSFRAITTNIGEEENAYRPMLLKKILNILKLCCDNGFMPFQNFLRDQSRHPTDMRVSVDLVNELTQYLINMHNIPEVKSPQKNEANSITKQCLKTLIDCCSGPCLLNQELVGARSRVYDFVNWFMLDAVDFKGQTTSFLKIFKQVVLFLGSIIEGQGSKAVATCMKDSLNFQILTQHATNIYRDLIYGREELVHQQNKGKSMLILSGLELKGSNVELEEYDRIESGFDIQILILSLRDIFPNEEALHIHHRSAFAEANLKTEEFADMLRVKSFKSAVRAKLNYFSQKVNQMLINRPEVDDEFNIVQAADAYYSMNIGRVEVMHKTELVKLLFYMPPVTKYVTEKSRLDLIIKVNRNSQQEQIEDFVNRSKGLQVEMEHQQELARWPVIAAFCSHWNAMAQIAFILLVILNLVLFASVEHVDGQTGDWRYIENSSFDVAALVKFLSISQVILGLLVVLCYLVEYYPLIIFKGKTGGSHTALSAYDDLRFRRVNGTILMQELVSITKKSFHERVSSSFDIVRSLVRDHNFVYSSIYFIMSVIGNIYVLFYCLLLLDIIRRSADLVNVLKAITMNWKQLLLTLVLGAIVIYLFSIIAFLELHEYYVDNGDADMNTYCYSLLSCFASTATYGVRAGGGIGDWIAQATWTDDKYWLRYAFDIAFFIIVVIILLNVIFGIIIDTFADLRDKRAEILKDIKETCFICGRNRFEFEVKHLSWKNHIYLEHNLYSYLAFIVYIRRKKLEDCTGAEKHAKLRALVNDVGFIPRTSISLEAMEDAQEAEDAVMARMTLKHLMKTKESLVKVESLAEKLIGVKAKAVA